MFPCQQFSNEVLKILPIHVGEILPLLHSVENITAGNIHPRCNCDYILSIK